MKNTKKLICILLSAVFVFALASCAKENKTMRGDTLSLEDIISEITTGVEDIPKSMNTVLDKDSFSYYLFTDYVEGAEAVAADALIGSIPHSVVLLRLPEGADGEAVAASIRDNINPRKWICVEAEKYDVVLHNNTILLCMSSENIEKTVVANFDKLWTEGA